MPKNRYICDAVLANEEKPKNNLFRVFFIDFLVKLILIA
jgi:hypothetical protein